MTLLPRSLRGRLTLAFTLLATAGVGASAYALAVLVEQVVWGPLDAGLVEEATTLAGLADLDPRLVAETVRHIGREGDLGPHKFLRVVDRDQRVVARFREPPAMVTARRPQRPTEVEVARVGHGRRAQRVAWAPTATGGWVEIGVRATTQDVLVRRARATIAAVAGALVVLLAVLAWVITSRATAALGRLARALETIEAGSLDRRLPRQGTREVDRLVAVLNRMLERLATSVSHLQRFSADAAHELRTPLAALRAHLEVAIARARTVAEHRAGLLDALEQAERLGRLSEDLLMLGRVESDADGFARAAGPVRVDLLAREVADFLAPVAEEQQRAFICEVPDAATVRGIPGLLKRVVLNLVDNAFRHTPPGVPVRLSVGGDQRAVRIEVADGGPGVAHGDVPHLFERFRRGSGSDAGAGLGLALVREIVQRHGGQVALESRPGRGTTVTVTLAREADAGVVAPPVAVAASDGRSASA